MPELPEVQALAERLTAFVGGFRLVGVEPLQFSALKTVTPAPESPVGCRVDGVLRRGKYLDFRLAGFRILVHLSQGGRCDLEEGSKPTRPKGAVVRLRFDPGNGPGVNPPVGGARGVLFKEFGTERKAGWWVLPAGEEGPLARLGPEPFSEAFEQLVLHGSDTGRVHAMLRDQRRVAGIGRGYSDDILHRAKLSPFRSLSSLDDHERARLLHSVRSVLGEALEVERRRTGGLPPKLGDHFTVHGKAGTPCPMCGGDLRRVSYESHEVTYCPTCQTGGKRLSDRRLDRLLP